MLGDRISFSGEGGAKPFSSIKLSMTNHIKSRVVDGNIICYMCIC